MEDATEVGATDLGVGKRAWGLLDLGKYIRVSGPGSLDVCFGDVGDDTAHWEGFGRIPQQGGTQADSTATAERGNRIRVHPPLAEAME